MKKLSFGLSLILSTALMVPFLAQASEPRSFSIDISQSKVATIQSRFENAALPDRLGAGDWGHGASHQFITQLVDFVAKDFDWRAAEQKLNAYPQYLAEVGGLNIHFYHVPGKGKNPTPLILTHGWPGSVYEFLDVIEPLTEPSKHGGNPEDSFTVVIPSLPGFGFSETTMDQPLGPVTTADLWHELMTEVLGYKRFGAQGGDLGCLVTTQLAIRHPDSLIGIHLNLVPWAMRPMEELTNEEKQWLTEVAKFGNTDMAYFGLQATKPTTPTFALSDSPVGTAAWIAEKLEAWSDHPGEITEAFSMEQIATLISLYTLTDTIDTSIWFYRGFAYELGGKFLNVDRIDVPTGVARFPEDLINGMPPKSWVEQQYNLVHWTDMPRGGHFAALEEPKLFADDVRAFFRQLNATRN